jgi:hypothetical protein
MILPMRPHPIYQSPGIMLGLDFLWLTKKLQVSQLVSSLHGYLPTLLSTTVLDDKKAM